MAQFKNYIRRQPLEPTYKNYSDEYIPYGANDNFPLKLSKLVSESPATSSCISVISDFIEGDGFSTDVGDKIVNNQGQTLSEVHHLLSESLAMYEGISLNVKYNAEASIVGIFFLPFENCRLGLPDDVGVIGKIKYNPYFGTGQYNKSKTITYDTFNPKKEVVLKQISEQKGKYKGQILYWGSTKALSRFYPQPSYYSAKNWMEVDARIGEYHVNNLRNGFLQSVLMKLIGNPNAPSTDPNDSEYDETNQKQQPVKTVGQVFDEMMSENFSGSERVGNVMALWASNKEEFPQIEAFPSSANSQILDTLQNLTTKNITIATKVPAILANIHEGVSLGGDGNTIQAAVKLMQQRASKWQSILEGHYDKIFSHWVTPTNEKVEIVDHQLFTVEKTVDPRIWAELNPETKKKWIQDNTNIEIIEPKPTVSLNPTNVLYSSYPDKAKRNAVTALRWAEESPGQCGTKMGWETARIISEGKPLSYKMIKRIKNYLEKNEEHMNKPFNESCDTVLFHAWGGRDMLEWAKVKIKEVEE